MPRFTKKIPGLKDSYTTTEIKGGGGKGVNPLAKNHATGRRMGGPGRKPGAQNKANVPQPPMLSVEEQDLARGVFLAELRKTPMIRRAAAVAGLELSGLYDRRNANPDFSDAWDKALQIGYTALEDEAVRRGLEGVQKPVFTQGKLVGHTTEYSDGLLRFVLGAAMPGKYRDPKLDANPKGGGQIAILTKDDEQL